MQGIFRKENTDKALKYGIYRHLPTYEKIIRNLVSFYAEKNTITQAKEDIALSMEAQIQNMENVLKSVEDMQQDMKNDALIYEFANQTRIMSNEIRQNYCRKVFQQLKYYQDRIAAVKVTNEVHSAYVYLPGQRMLFASNLTYFEDFTLWDVDFLNQYNTYGEEMLNRWIPTVPVSYETIHHPETWDKYSKLLTYCDVVRNDTGRIIAVFALNLKPEFLETYYNGIQNSNGREIIVCDKDGMVYSGDTNDLRYYQEKYADGSATHLDSEEIVRDDVKLVVTRTSAYTGWTFVSFASRKELLQSVKAIKLLLYKIVLLSAVGALLLSRFLSGYMYRPLKSLISYMRKVRKGDFSVRIEEKRKDEFEEVYSGFNRMLDELNNTMNNLETEKLLNKEAKIHILQEQINPHFLYNTLDTIFSMAKIKGEEAIAKMVFSLSKFFRISLSDGKNIVTLREASELFENYLSIQEIRFPGKFDYQINIPEELMTYMVPKFLLQPFVENSISHGLERSAGKGTLYIEGKEKNGILYFLVEDNGKGIPEEKLKDIQKVLEENTSSEYFAVSNINSLIKLKYGSGYGVTITSKYEEWTKVQIVMPANMERV